MTEILQTFTIHPGEAASGRIAAGQTLRVTDVDGGQIADLLAWTASSPHRYQDTGHTVGVAGRWRLRLGDPVVGSVWNRMWTLVADSTEGRHYWGGGCCTRAVNAVAGVDQDGCAEIVRHQLQRLGLNSDLMEQKAAINLFSAREFHSDGTVTGGPPPSVAGDFIELRADDDLVWVAVCCPYPDAMVHGGSPSPHRIEVLAEAPSA